MTQNGSRNLVLPENMGKNLQVCKRCKLQIFVTLGRIGAWVFYDNFNSSNNQFDPWRRGSMYLPQERKIISSNPTCHLALGGNLVICNLIVIVSLCIGVKYVSERCIFKKNFTYIVATTD
jgi:hypothetical protein